MATGTGTRWTRPANPSYDIGDVVASPARAPLRGLAGDIAQKLQELGLRAEGGGDLDGARDGTLS